MSQTHFEWNLSSFFADDFSLVKSVFSFEPFQSISEALWVLGSYTIAALVLPWIMNIILSPFGFALILLGVIGIGMGLYQYFSNEYPSVDFFNNQTNTGLVLLTLGALLSFASVFAALVIAAVGLFRILGALPDEYTHPFKEGAAQVISYASSMF